MSDFLIWSAYWVAAIGISALIEEWSIKHNGK